MTRLDLELQRLFKPADPAVAVAHGAPPLCDADGGLRTLVLDLHGPADWALLAPVWQAVQAELELPAPAIAVNGRDGFQLWFSLAAAVPAAEGTAFLRELCQRHLASVPERRLRQCPGKVNWQPGPVPAPQAGLVDQWSAFVSQDLAPMFSDTPWLDMPPNRDGQAGLLAGLRSATPAQWQQALELLGLRQASREPAAQEAQGGQQTTDTLQASGAGAAAALPGTAPLRAVPIDPRQFLQSVLDDTSVPLALRIDAAKALLQVPPRA